MRPSRPPPRRPPRPCTEPGCPALVPATQRARCAEHQRPCDAGRRHDAKRASSGERGYDARWRKVRLVALERDRWLCQMCLARGDVTSATLVDHIQPLSLGGARLDLGNLQALCAPCHAHKTAQDGSREARPDTRLVERR